MAKRTFKFMRRWGKYIGRIATLRRRGKSINTIAQMLNIKPSQVYYIMSTEDGYTTRKGKPVRGSSADKWILSKISDLVMTPQPEYVTLTQISRPAVYVFLSESDEPLYVGQSVNGLRRVMDRSQDQPHRMMARSRAARVAMYYVEELYHLSILEARLIAELKPKYNVRIAPLMSLKEH